jgi:hypothetical protein
MLALVTGVTEDELQLRTTEEEVATAIGDSAPGHYDRVRVGMTKKRRDAEAFKGGMTVKEINAAFGERAGELKKPAKRVGLIDMGLIHLFMM